MLLESQIYFKRRVLNYPFSADINKQKIFTHILLEAFLYNVIIFRSYSSNFRKIIHFIPILIIIKYLRIFYLNVFYAKL